MSKRRRRDDGGDFAIFTLPFEHPYWAMAYAIAPMIQVAQQYGMVPMYG